MFKKIEIWILYLVVLLGIPITVGFGYLVKYEIFGGTRFGMISKSALFLAEMPSNLKRILSGESVDLTVEDKFPLLDAFDGIPNSSESYLILTRYDGDIKEGIVELVDLTTFEVIHTWNPDIDKFNKLVPSNYEFKSLMRDGNNSRFVPRHPILLEDGGLVFHRETPLRKIDKCSNLVFQNSHDNFHHSIELDADGNIWVPSYMYPQTLPIDKVGRKFIPDGGYQDDGIVKISPEGKILFEKSVSQIFIDNGLEYLLFSVGDSQFMKDPIHLNDIQPVLTNGNFWQKGDVFLSLRHQSMVLLYRPSTNKIIWKGKGPFFHQHDVDILNDYSISVFNNNSKNFVDGDIVDGHNEVIIYDFIRNEYSSYLNESLIKNDVRTNTEGLSEVLPNGDLFLEETNSGRLLYIDADGTIRWSYVNRAENGKVYVVSWARILYDKKDIKIVNNFLQSDVNCVN